MSESEEDRRAAAAEESEAILTALADTLPQHLDGRDAILQMKDEGSNHWRQMEWQGFYFEHVAMNTLPTELGGGRGPEFGNTEFDYANEFVWDVKAHSTVDRRTGYAQNIVLLNAADAMEACIREHGGLGFIVAHVKPEWEDPADQWFRAWHAELKGKKTDYVKKREQEEGRGSRPRKTEVEFEKLVAYYIDSVEELEQGLEEGWLSGFQDGMRNSNGNARKGKFKMNTSKVPDRIIVAEVDEF